MSALLDAYQDYLSKNQAPAIPSVAAVPQSLADSYYKGTQTPATVAEPTGLQDIYPAAQKAYYDNAGGWKGTGAAILAGLGKAGEFVASKTGSNILAGTSKSPYLAQGYLNQADLARQNEIAQRTNAWQMNLEKQKEQGESVRNAAQQDSELQKTILQNKLEMPLKLTELDIRNQEAETQRQRATQEAANSKEQREQDNLKLNEDVYQHNYSDRSPVSKFLGVGAPVRTDNPGGQPITKKIGNQTFINQGGKWYVAG